MLRSFPAAVVAAALVTQLSIFTTTIYLHRVLAHRAVVLHPGVALFFRAITWITTGLVPRQWVAVHRLHHAKTDQPEDPHSPLQLGYWKVQLTNPYLYRKAATNPAVLARYAKDLPGDAWDRRLFDRPFVGLGLGIGVLCVVLGPVLGLAAAAMHTFAYLLLSGAVNAIGHTWGRRPYDNSATNSQWLAWLTAGEGLHNNHHAVPTAGRLAIGSREIDPGWWVIRMLERRGWATVRLQPAEVRAKAAA
ncbi:MAG: fatty acid desaturase [Acidimicrobiia bacterium]